MNEILLSILVTVLGAVVTVWLGGFVVGRIVSPYADQLDENSGLKEGGRLIGYCERLLIYVFVLANAPSAIGFLVTAKSLFRFGEVTGAEKRRHTECESGVESEKEHRGGEPTKRVNQQSPVRTHLRGPLNAGFLVDPVEKRLDRLPNPAYSPGKQFICRW